MDDLVVVVGATLEEVRAVASVRNYRILYERRFDAVRLDSPAGGIGSINFDGKGAVAIAKR